MSSRKSTLSRRELFGRLTGRSRSEAAAEREPDRHPSAQRADELLADGDYQKASELYARLTMREPGFLEAYRRLGWCYLKLDMTAEARRVLEQLLDNEPEDATALLYIALSHAMDGSAENAVTVLRDVHDYNRIVVQREVNLIQFLADSQEMPGAEDLVERIERVIQEQNRMPGTIGVYF
jgi:Flp pilus assembly protein TadD